MCFFLFHSSAVSPAQWVPVLNVVGSRLTSHCESLDEACLLGSSFLGRLAGEPLEDVIRHSIHLAVSVGKCLSIQ